MEIKERIRKCLNLADISKGATEAEALAALTAAKKLMLENNLSMSDVELQEQSEVGANEVADSLKKTTRPAWERYLAHVVDKLFGTRHYLHQTLNPKNGKYFWKVIFVGAGNDASVAAESYTILVNMIWGMARQRGYFQGRTNTSYCTGVVSAMMKRVREKVQDETPEQEERERGIMVLKDQIVRKFMEEKHLTMVNERRRTIDGDAYNHGLLDGATVNMNMRNSLR